MMYTRCILDYRRRFFGGFWNHPSPPWTLPVQYGVLREASRGEAGRGSSFRRRLKHLTLEDFREDVDGEPLVFFFEGVAVAEVVLMIKWSNV